MIQPKLTKAVLLGRVLPRRVTGCLYLVNANCNPEGRIRPFPDLWICPVLIILRSIDHGIEGRVDLSPFQNILRFLVGLVADGLRIRPCRCDEEVKRLHSCIAGAFRHNVKELAIRLRMKFVKHNAVNIEAVL